MKRSSAREHAHIQHCLHFGDHPRPRPPDAPSTNDLFVMQARTRRCVTSRSRAATSWCRSCREALTASTSCTPAKTGARPSNGSAARPEVRRRAACVQLHFPVVGLDGIAAPMRECDTAAPAVAEPSLLRCRGPAAVVLVEAQGLGRQQWHQAGRGAHFSFCMPCRV